MHATTWYMAAAAHACTLIPGSGVIALLAVPTMHRNADGGNMLLRPSKPCLLCMLCMCEQQHTACCSESSMHLLAGASGGVTIFSLYHQGLNLMPTCASTCNKAWRALAAASAATRACSEV